MSPDFSRLDPMICWTAGIIDGEGSVSVDVSGKDASTKYYCPRVDVGMAAKGEAVLQLLQQQYGGKVRTTRKATERWQEARCWTISGASAANFLRQILDALILKQPQARLAIRLDEIRKEGWSVATRSRARLARLQIMDLNRKGPRETEPPMWITGQRQIDGTFSPFSDALPSAGAMRNGELWELTTLALPTAESASGSGARWPTPQAQMPGAGENNSKVQNLLTGNRHSLYLTHAVKAEELKPGEFSKAIRNWPTPRAAADKMGRPRENDRDDLQAAAIQRTWPTPTSRDHKDGGFCPNVPINALLGRAVWTGPTAGPSTRQMWCTPKTMYADTDPDKARARMERLKKKGRATGGIQNLEMQAIESTRQMWSTPQARDWKGESGRSIKGTELDLPMQVKKSREWATPRSGIRSTHMTYDRGKHNLEEQTGASVKGGGQLNPSWVEWLMGFPIGWTALNASATPSSRPLSSGSEGELDE
jgi:hypothetical protein